LNVEAFCDAHSLQTTPDPKGRGINVLNYMPSHLNTAAPGTWKLRIVLTSRRDSRRVHTELADVAMSPGRNWLRHSFEIQNALLWWPNGLGTQDLYEVEVTLLRDGEPTDSLAFAAGIRTIATERSPGPQSRDRWDDWQFVANGQPFFAKGVNWAPIDYFLHLPREQYRWMLELARDAGIQLIRVNAYGIIETEDFYDLCDEFGILVWQDFVIANACASNFPLDVWKNQILTNIFRLRNRASLAVYCGGNEFNAYSPLHVAAIGVLEAAITDFDGTRLFRRVSPDHGSVHEYPDCDATWLQHIYRWFPFLAEIGVHSFPHADSLRRLICAEELDHPLVNICDDTFAEAHPQLTHHFAEYWVSLGYRNSRWPRILNYASAFADVSAPTIEDLCEASQMAAAEFYQMFSDAAQANYPVTTGLMPWVFARPFLQVAMQLVDASGTPIPSYYALRRSYEPTHAIVQFPHLLWAPGEKMPVTMKAMHSGAALPVSWSLRVLDAAFAPRWERSGSATLPAGPSLQILLTDAFEIPARFAESLFCLIGELRDESGALLSRSVYWPRCLDRMKEDALRESYRAKAQTALRFENGPWLKPQVSATRTALHAEYRPASDGRSEELLVSNTGNTPAFPVNVRSASGQIIAASDAYFLLMPGESRLLGIRLREPVPITSLAVVAWNAEPVTVTLPPAKTKTSEARNS
jgi:beta-mannosidase